MLNDPESSYSRALWPVLFGFGLAVFFFVAASGALAAPGLPADGSGLAEVGESKDGVRIRVVGMPMAELLQRIEAETGIRFDFPESMAAELITAHVNAATWKDALGELLEDKNRIELWDARQRLTSIRLLSTREWEPGTAPPATAPASNRTTSARLAPPNAGGSTTLSKEQLAEISKGPYRSPLPETLYRNLSLRPFLESNGIRSEDDLKDTRKAMRVRREARKQLRILRKQERKASSEK